MSQLKVMTLPSTGTSLYTISENICGDAGDVTWSTSEIINDKEKATNGSRRRKLLRSFTLASIPTTFEKTSRMFQLAKAPLKVKFLVSPKGAAWFLEEDIEHRPSLASDTQTDSTPFSYNSSQTYYSSAPCSPSSDALTRKKKASVPINADMSPRPSISLENIHRLRVSSSKITLDGHDDQTEIPEPDDEKGSTMTLEDKNRPLRRSFSFTQRNFRRNAVIEAPGGELSVKTKRKRDNVLEAFFKAVEHQDVEQVTKLLSTHEVEVNELNDDGFTPLDVSLMLHSDGITSQLLEREARESNRLSASLLENHLKMLQTFAEEQVDHYVADVVNKGNTDAKESEKQLKECEWRCHLLRKMLVGFQGLALPSKPTTVFLSAASETSLLVRFSGPAAAENSPVTKFKVQWSRDKSFDSLDGEYFSHNILDKQYTISELQKSIAYYVRVCVGNIRGYGEWMMSSPPCVVPSSWHEIDDSIPRFQGRLDRIAKLFEEVQIYQTSFRHPRGPESKSFRLRRSPQMHRKRASSWHVPTGHEVCYTDRKDSKKRSFTKYAKLLTSTPKFVKDVKRGIYLATVFYTKDDKILVTLDENLPIVEVDDSSSGSFMQEFQWLLKVGCTWQDIKMLKDQVERNLSSTSVYLRGRLLQALDTLQAGVGCDDLGQLHYQIIKDKNGTNIIVITKRIKNPSFIRSRTLSMKWISLSKLQKKTIQKDVEDSPNAVNQIVSQIQDVISYHQQTKKPLDKGLYIGLMKLRTSVDAIHITVPRYSPNILPHVKVRDNPHVSREEWEWLTGLTTMPEEELATENLPSFQSTIENALKTLLNDIGVSRKENYRIYDREVVELSKDVSLLILVPPPEHVCSCPGEGDIFSVNDRFLSIPVPVFEMNVMKTYQNQFICHYSRLSSILDMASLISQQDCRKAILEDEVNETRAAQDALSNFQKELDETWKGMRWLLDILHYSRDRESVSGIPLDLVFDTRRPCSPEPYDSHRKHSERKTSSSSSNGITTNPESGILKIYSACETGLAPGKSIKLHVTPCTTVQQVVQLVVRQLEILVKQKKPDTKPLTEEKLKEFCLVAVIGARERCLNDDYKILQLQNPWVKGKLFVRLRVEAIAADNRSPSTSV
ncbi:ankyrin repeat and fibronectin type-III domain-containing protein 1-like isoform X3 [Dendronephthya gigantea]|uniref:ankyrin repeat and fibronectin type-III domain-containing protein 1-like isoform X3 n=1 Tax=Dendronephthya gigantea TaxID=151771 RepID=UPI00106D5595|nr:ankyrin repeat and fibronectin type-III domain-containing protein 1-like isoform X3 [Dendronephthya gigantea]